MVVLRGNLKTAGVSTYCFYDAFICGDSIVGTCSISQQFATSRHIFISFQCSQLITKKNCGTAVEARDGHEKESHREASELFSKSK